MIAENCVMFAAPWRYVCRSGERDMLAALGDMFAAHRSDKLASIIIFFFFMIEICSPLLEICLPLSEICLPLGRKRYVCRSGRYVCRSDCVNVI